MHAVSGNLTVSISGNWKSVLDIKKVNPNLTFENYNKKNAGNYQYLPSIKKNYQKKN